jgi:hypothetical protein
MQKNYPFALIIITLLMGSLLLQFGFISIDESSYFRLTRVIVEKGQFSFDTEQDEIYSPLERSFMGVDSGDRIYSVFPPGYPFLASPFYLFFGREGMQIANLFFAVILNLTFYFLLKEFYSEKEAFIGSIILLIGTQILNYSVSLWSHVSASIFIVLSFLMLFRKRFFWAGASIGFSIVIRYSGASIVPILLAYVYFKEKNKIPKFLVALILGLSPLLYYNLASFGSPFISGMSILNAEEGYRAINLQNIPKTLITNLFHYTFFPELELMPDKSSLIETSPLFIFFILGAFLFWREKTEMQAEFFTLLGSVSVFFFFISGTWSLGGLAHNMRLLTDIIPLIIFFSVIPLFYLNLDDKLVLGVIAFFALSGFLISTSFENLKFINLLVSLFALVVVISHLLLKKNLSSPPWRLLMGSLLLLSIGMSVFTSVYVTRVEGLNRKNVRSAAQSFDSSIPEGSVVFVYFGDYPMYSEKDYLFFDYSRGEEDISRVVEVYKDRPIYVLFKTEENRKLFEKFKLNPAGPIRSYQLMIE